MWHRPEQTNYDRRGRGVGLLESTAARWRRRIRGALGDAGSRYALAAPVFLLVVGLTAFHAEILWRRLASMTLLEPPVALRWALSAAALAGLLQLRRAGVSLLRDRRALAFWLAVLLLHTSLPFPLGLEAAGIASPGSAAALLVMLPATATLSVVLGVALALQVTGRAVSSRGRPRRIRPRTALGSPFLSRAYPRLLSRPPPR